MLTKNIKAMKSEVAAHIAADAVIQGTYWDDDRGCFIGCLAHSDKAEAVTDKFGMPLPLVKIAEYIFEKLPIADAKTFFAAVPEAIGSDGKDLSRVHWLFLADTLRNLPPQEGEVKAAINRVIAGMDRLSIGEDWPDAARAARAAYAADYAAADAARAAAYAASAAFAAADAAPATHAYAARAAADAARAAAYAARAADYAAADAARAADYAASAADYAADYAARAADYAAPATHAYAARAADTAADASDAAYAAEINRQRGVFLRLLREAK